MKKTKKKNFKKLEQNKIKKEEGKTRSIGKAGLRGPVYKDM